MERLRVRNCRVRGLRHVLLRSGVIAPILVARGKPAPTFSFMPATRDGMVHRIVAVVIEDSPAGRSGRRVPAGMRTLGFTGGSHLSERKRNTALFLSR